MNSRYEQLLEFIVNGDQDEAKKLFHKIVVEESRKIYADLLEFDMSDEANGPVDSLVDDVEAEENGVDAEGGEEVVGDEVPVDGDVTADADVIADDMGGEDVVGEPAPEEGMIADRVDDMEAEMNALKADFERIMDMVDVDGDGDHDLADHEAEAEEAGAVDDASGLEGDVEEEPAAEEGSEEPAEEPAEEEGEKVEEAINYNGKKMTAEKPSDSGKKSPLPQNSGKGVFGDAKAVDFTKGDGAGKNGKPTVKDNGGKYGNEPDQASAPKLTNVAKPKAPADNGNKKSLLGGK